MTQTPKEQWLDRERIQDVRDRLDAIAALLEPVPHGVAERIIRHLASIEGVVTDDIGEIMGRCEHCEEMVCLDDEGTVNEDVLICADCVARWNTPTTPDAA